MLLSLAQLQDLHSLAVQQLIEFITGAVTTLQSCVEGEPPPSVVMGDL